jgi:hypothetical protein
LIQRKATQVHAKVPQVTSTATASTSPLQVPAAILGERRAMWNTSLALAWPAVALKAKIIVNFWQS